MIIQIDQTFFSKVGCVIIAYIIAGLMRYLYV